MKLMCFLKTDDRVRRFFVQVWKICLNALAFFPMLSLVSVLGLALPAFLLSIFFSKDITLSILEIIILLFLIVFYLKLFSKRRNSEIAILTYWCISISTLIIFFLIDVVLFSILYCNTSFFTIDIVFIESILSVLLSLVTLFLANSTS